jgi:hypothetical protein
MGIDLRDNKLSVLEEGVSVSTTTSSIDFVGSGVNVSSTGPVTTVTIPGGAGNTTFYLNQTVTQTPYKEFSSVATSAVEQVVPLTVAGGVTSVIAEYMTPSGVPNTTQIPVGLWQFFLHFNAGAAGQNWIIRPTVYKRSSGGVETLLFTADPEIVTGMSTTTTMYTCDGVFPSTALLTTDRILVRISMQNTTGVSQTVNFRTEGSQHYSVAATTLNQVVPAGAVTAVTGTAPVVSSGGTTPAISMPAATGSVNGYLASSDWTVFNAKQNAITLTTTGSSGAATLIGDTLNIPNYAGGSSGGIFGIANTSGVYTYYATPALAYAAATVGQTIELFADYTTSGSEVLTITKNVNWNGNGHTWTKTAANETAIFTSGYTSCKFSMLNLNLVRQNGTNPSDILVSNLFNTTSGVSGRILMTGSYFENQSTQGTAISIYTSSSLEVVGLTAKGVNIGAFVGSLNTVNNCLFYGVTGCQIDGTANNCSFNGTTGNGVSATANAKLNNCNGISVSGSGISGGGYIYNSIGRSTSGFGIESSSGIDLIGCTGISVSGQGIYLFNSTSKNMVNNTGVSSSSNGIRFQASHCFNGTSISTSNASFWDTASNGKLYNCNIITSYNNAAGYGILGNAGTLPNSLINCNFNLINATAPYIFNSGTAKVIKMRGNTYEGGAAFNANITQGITNTEDNQGNIYL